MTSERLSRGTLVSLALGASRSTYETEARPGNSRPLPDWDTIRTNPEMKQAAEDLDRLRTSLGRP